MQFNDVSNPNELDALQMFILYLDLDVSHTTRNTGFACFWAVLALFGFRVDPDATKYMDPGCLWDAWIGALDLMPRDEVDWSYREGHFFSHSLEQEILATYCR